MLLSRFLGIALMAALVAPAFAENDSTKTSAKKDAKKDHAKMQKVERISSNAIIGQSVYHQGSEDAIGTVNDLVINSEGKAQYAMVGTGGVAGIGQTTHAVPVKAFEMKWEREEDDKQCKLMLNMSADELAKAPKVSLEHARDLTVDTFVERNSKFFKAKDAKVLKPDNMHLVSELTDLKVTGNGNKSLGVLEGLVFGGKDCTAEFAILGTGGALGGIGEEYTAVPFDSVTITKTSDNQYKASIAADETTVGAAPKVTAENYDELDNEEVRNNIEDAFASTDS